MRIEYYKINPTGNISLLVTSPVPRAEQRAVANALMALDPDAEQVGFIERPDDENAEARLQMMGGEFCGNASISTAALIAYLKGLRDGRLMLEVSGVSETLCLDYNKLSDRVFLGEVRMPQYESISEYRFGAETLPLIRFPGICHIIAERRHEKLFGRSELKSICEKLGTEALGIMFYDGALMLPYVYVASTDTAVKESSCASGATALAVYLASKNALCGEFSFDTPGGRLSVSVSPEELRLKGRAEIIEKNDITL